MNDKEKIQYQELREIFGDFMPMEAANLIQFPGDRSKQELLAELKRIRALPTPDSDVDVEAQLDVMISHCGNYGPGKFATKMLHDLTALRASLRSRNDAAVEALRDEILEEARQVAISQSNFGHIEGNRRAFLIADLIKKRIAVNAVLQGDEG